MTPALQASPFGTTPADTAEIVPDDARSVIEKWRREYNEERPKKHLGGITPAQHAEQLKKKAMAKAVTVHPGL